MRRASGSPEVFSRLKAVTMPLAMEDKTKQCEKYESHTVVTFRHCDSEFQQALCDIRWRESGVGLKIRIENVEYFLINDPGPWLVV